jgi:hypothetical protein
VAESFDDALRGDDRRRGVARVQQRDRVHRRIGAAQERRARAAFAALLGDRAARLALAQVRIAVRDREELRDDERQRERDMNERLRLIFSASSSRALPF